jgi:lysyl-tRNA synthetase class 1
MTDIRALAEHAKAWPFEEARQLLDRVGKGGVPEKGYVLFQTGYGPSGLPHIGTFGEVARTLMVRHAFEQLSDVPTRLFAFSDDMDGLRKVPDNIPNKEMVAEHLGKPLTAIPDPFGTHDSFGAHNNARLRAFLDEFGFSYEFVSATECYKSGRFDAALLKVLAHYDAVMDVILPTRGPERRATYSPFLPVCPETGVVLQVPMVARNLDAGTVVYERADGKRVETPVTGGACKLQWKADWAMRWTALDVDYEMSGKDLIDSVRLSGRICRILGGNPPVGFTYELFLDEKGEKISKSIGNGLSVEEWLRYAPPESLAQFMFQKPKAAKRLYFDVIPRQVDDYLQHLAAYPTQEPERQIENPAWHIHRGPPPAEDAHLSYNILLNLASVCHTALPPGCLAGHGAGARPAGVIRHQLLPGLHQAGQAVPRAGRSRTRRAGGTGRRARRHAGRLGCRGDPDASLRGRQAPRLREPEGLVRLPLRSAARPAAGAAHGLLHPALRHQGNHRTDRPRAEG